MTIHAWYDALSPHNITNTIAITTYHHMRYDPLISAMGETITRSNDNNDDNDDDDEIDY
jgi:hypothetical protein